MKNVWRVIAEAQDNKMVYSKVVEYFDGNEIDDIMTKFGSYWKQKFGANFNKITSLEFQYLGKLND